MTQQTLREVLAAGYGHFWVWGTTSTHMAKSDRWNLCRLSVNRPDREFYLGGSQMRIDAFLDRQAVGIPVPERPAA